MAVELRTQPFAPWQELAAMPGGGLTDGAFGATCAFVGTMRDFNDDRRVERMTLEYYPGMTERELRAIVDYMTTTHDLLAARVVHRVGAIAPGEPIVLVAVWSAHRRNAFEGARALMEALKARAPFWKHEETAQGGRWVEHNTPG